MWPAERLATSVLYQKRAPECESGALFGLGESGVAVTALVSDPPEDFGCWSET